MTAPTVGVFGLGAMGAAIAGRLQTAGLPLSVYDFDQAAMQLYVVEGGSAIAPSPRAMAETADTLVVALSTDEAVRAAVLGANGLVNGLRKGSPLVIVGAGPPDAIVALDRALVSHGVATVDAVVLGSTKDVAGGRAALLAGGTQRALDIAAPVLEALGAPVIRTGTPGTARAAHAICGFLTAAGLIAGAEGLLIARRYGLDPRAALEAVGAVSTADNAALAILRRLVDERRYDSGSEFAALVRAVDTATCLAHDTGTFAPVAALCREICTAATNNLEGPRDGAEIVRWLEQVAKTSLGRDD